MDYLFRMDTQKLTNRHNRIYLTINLFGFLFAFAPVIALIGFINAPFKKQFLVIAITGSPISIYTLGFLISAF